jgi:hypothetical protein
MANLYIHVKRGIFTIIFDDQGNDKRSLLLLSVLGALADLGDIDELAHGQPAQGEHYHHHQPKQQHALIYFIILSINDAS